MTIKPSHINNIYLQLYILLCILYTYVLSDIIIGKDNTFIEGTRTTMTFDISEGLEPGSIKSFHVRAMDINEDAPIAFQAEMYPYYEGTLNYWPIFVDKPSLWGQSSYQKESSELSCWLTDHPTINIGYITIANANYRQEYFLDVDSIPQFRLEFISHITITSDMLIRCYIQSINGSFITQIKVGNTSVRIIENKPQIDFKDVKKGPVYPLVSLTILMNRVQPYSVYPVQLGLYSEGRYVRFSVGDDSDDSDDGDDDGNGTTNKSDNYNDNITTNQDTIEHIHNIMKSSSTLQSDSAQHNNNNTNNKNTTPIPSYGDNTIAPHYMGSYKMITFPYSLGGIDWPSYPNSWICNNNKARLYIGNPSNQVIGNMRYFIMTSGDVTQSELITCNLLFHNDIMIDLQLHQKNTNIYTYSDELTRPLYTDGDSHKKMKYTYLPFMRIGNIYTVNINILNYYYNLDHIVTYYNTISQQYDIICRDITPISDQHDAPLDFSCKSEGAYRISSITFRDPSGYAPLDNNIGYNLHQYSHNFTPNDLDGVLTNLSENVTSHNGILTIDISTWKPDSTSIYQPQEFKFTLNRQHANIKHKYILPVGYICGYRALSLPDGTYDTTTNQWCNDYVPFIIIQIPLSIHAKRTIYPAYHNIDIDITPLNDSVYIPPGKDIPIYISPYDKDMNISHLYRILQNNSHDSITCSATIGQNDERDKIVMKYMDINGLPVWHTIIHNALYDNTSNSSIHITCRINTDYFISYPIKSQLFIYIFNNEYSTTIDNIYHDTIYTTSNKIYQYKGIYTESILFSTIPTLYDIVVYYQYILTHTHMDYKCRGVLGHITPDDISISDIQVVPNPNFIEYFPGHSTSYMTLSAYSIKFIIKESVESYNHLPLACPPNNFPLEVYPSSATQMKKREMLYDTDIINTYQDYIPTLANNEICDNGFQCKDIYSSCINKKCTPLYYPSDISILRNTGTSFIQLL